MHKLLPTSLLLVLPTFAYGAVADVMGAQIVLFNIITRLSFLAWAALFAFFVFGVVKFISNADDTAEREKGKDFIKWAIICFVVLVSIWALVSLILTDTLGIAIGGTPGFVTD